MKESIALKSFPVITKYEANSIEYRMRFDRNARKTIEVNGIFYDIRTMTDDQADTVYKELHDIDFL